MSPSEGFRTDLARRTRDTDHRRKENAVFYGKAHQLGLLFPGQSGGCGRDCTGLTHVSGPT